MRKALRFLLLAVAMFAMPATNALDMHCYPGEFKFVQGYGYQCQFEPTSTHCLVCYGAITVQG